MADVYGTTATGILNATAPAAVLGASYGGSVGVLNDTYEAAAAAAGTDVIVGKLRAGSIIQPDSVIFCDAMGASTTLGLSVRNVDDSTDETVIYAAQDSSSAAVLGPVAADIATVGVKLASDSYVIVKIAGGAATGTIKTFVRYAN